MSSFQWHQEQSSQSCRPRGDFLILHASITNWTWMNPISRPYWDKQALNLADFHLLEMWEKELLTKPKRPNRRSIPTFQRESQHTRYQYRFHHTRAMRSKVTRHENAGHNFGHTYHKLTIKFTSYICATSENSPSSHRTCHLPWCITTLGYLRQQWNQICGG